ncbi:MAG TPA: RDD family protein [Streptosporangiaceae bacterium]|nr:RDD family protein [Streptosporangiaceae bacterium]
MTQTRAGDSMGAARTPPSYPGKDLGLPETGAGSIASMSRRIGAIFIDWLLCTFIVVALVRPARPDVEYWTLLIFAAQDYLLTALTGFTIGKRLLRIRVVKLDGKMVGLLWGLLRTFLVLTVIPTLLMNRDMRGLHDRACNTAVVRV